MKIPKIQHWLACSFLLLVFSSFAYTDTKAKTADAIIYEAEDATMHKLRHESNHEGFSGTGFIGGFYNNSNGLLTFKIKAKKAGVQNITISNTGDVYRAICKVGGKLGNIYDGFEMPNSTIICNKPRCICSADVQLSKALPEHVHKLRIGDSE